MNSSLVALKSGRERFFLVRTFSLSIQQISVDKNIFFAFFFFFVGGRFVSFNFILFFVEYFLLPFFL